jgi:hypothetical protein
MQEDDVMPNDGYFVPREPTEVVETRKKAEGNAKVNEHLIKKMIKRLEHRITFYESVHSIPDEVRTLPNEFMAVHNGNTVTVQNLKEERDYLEQMLES